MECYDYSSHIGMDFSSSLRFVRNFYNAWIPKRALWRATYSLIFGNSLYLALHFHKNFSWSFRWISFYSGCSRMEYLSFCRCFARHYGRLCCYWWPQRKVTFWRLSIFLIFNDSEVWFRNISYKKFFQNLLDLPSLQGQNFCSLNKV